MTPFSWLQLSGQYPSDWEFSLTPHPQYPGAQLFSPWLGPEDETGRALGVMMLRHPGNSGGSLSSWFERTVIDSGIDRKIPQTRDFAGAPGYWLIPKPGSEDIDLVIYAEFMDHIYQFRFIGFDSEERLAPDLPLSAVLRSMMFGGDAAL